MPHVDPASGPAAPLRPAGPLTIMGHSIDDLLNSFVRHLADPVRSAVAPIYAFVTVSNAGPGGVDCEVATGTAPVRLVDGDLVCDCMTLHIVGRVGTAATAGAGLGNAGFSIKTRPNPLTIMAGSRQATAAMAEEDVFFFAASRGGSGARVVDQADLMTVVMRKVPCA